MFVNVSNLAACHVADKGFHAAVSADGILSSWEWPCCRLSVCDGGGGGGVCQ
jgi:hypothetical protein